MCFLRDLCKFVTIAAWDNTASSYDSATESRAVGTPRWAASAGGEAGDAEKDESAPA